MANTNSTQITNMAAYKDTANATGGRLRGAYFNVAVVPVGAGDTMTLTKLPKGARVVGGWVQFGAAQGATATTAIGISGTAAKYRVAAITNALTQFAIADTAAVGAGTETTAEETIIATNAAAVWTTTTFHGIIWYMTD